MATPGDGRGCRYNSVSEPPGASGRRLSGPRRSDSGGPKSDLWDSGANSLAEALRSRVKCLMDRIIQMQVQLSNGADVKQSLDMYKGELSSRLGELERTIMLLEQELVEACNLDKTSVCRLRKMETQMMMMVDLMIDLILQQRCCTIYSAKYRAGDDLFFGFYAIPVKESLRIFLLPFPNIAVLRNAIPLDEAGLKVTVGTLTNVMKSAVEVYCECLIYPSLFLELREWATGDCQDSLTVIVNRRHGFPGRWNGRGRDELLRRIDKNVKYVPRSVFMKSINMRRQRNMKDSNDLFRAMRSLTTIDFTKANIARLYRNWNHRDCSDAVPGNDLENSELYGSRSVRLQFDSHRHGCASYEKIATAPDKDQILIIRGLLTEAAAAGADPQAGDAAQKHVDPSLKLRGQSKRPVKDDLSIANLRKVDSSSLQKSHSLLLDDCSGNNSNEYPVDLLKRVHVAPGMEESAGLDRYFSDSDIRDMALFLHYMSGKFLEMAGKKKRIEGPPK